MGCVCICSGHWLQFAVMIESFVICVQTWGVFVFVQDTGISVRKRVIKIFRDICMDQPEFPKIPEMCVRMIRRVNDEEGIKVIFLSLKSRIFSVTFFGRNVINV